jgi:hypothetical protein
MRGDSLTAIYVNIFGKYLKKCNLVDSYKNVQSVLVSPGITSNSPGKERNPLLWLSRNQSGFGVHID